MSSGTCPFLGLKEDPNSVLDFASEGNYCYRARPASPVIRSHQEDFCLTSEHANCPVFLRETAAPLPAELVPVGYRQSQTKRVLLGSVAVVLLIAVGIVLASFLKNVGFSGASGAAEPSQMSGFTESTPAPTHTLSLLAPQDAELTLTPFSPVATAAATATLEPGISSCQVPEGWVAYSVKPTDSIFRLSLIYGVSVPDLQASNCMGESKTLHAGQVIYVPNLPTNTPTFTVTPSPTKAPAFTETPRFTRTPKSGGVIVYPTTKPISTQPPRPTNTVSPPTAKPTNPPVEPTNPPVEPTNPPDVPTSAPTEPPRTEAPPEQTPGAIESPPAAPTTPAPPESSVTETPPESGATETSPP